MKMNRILFLTAILMNFAVVSLLAQTKPKPKSASSNTQQKMDDKVVKTDEEWRKILTPEQYEVLREKGTERAFTGKLYKVKDKGMYVCGGCGADLFTSDQKYDSGCGWPSFYDSVDKTKIKTTVDTSHGMVRTEITCARCDGHLGHIFDDGPKDKTGLRYCVNSLSLGFKKSQ